MRHINTIFFKKLSDLKSRKSFSCQNFFPLNVFYVGCSKEEEKHFNDENQTLNHRPIGRSPRVERNLI